MHPGRPVTSSSRFNPAKFQKLFDVMPDAGAATSLAYQSKVLLMAGSLHSDDSD